jgi:hypothetical protein
MGYHRSTQRYSQRRLRYAIIDDRPFLHSDSQTSGDEAKSAPYPRDVIEAMRNFDFTNVTHKAVTVLVKLFVDYRNKDHPPPFRVGKFGIINYGLGRHWKKSPLSLLLFRVLSRGSVTIARTI